jgi:hypothetical protein
MTKKINGKDVVIMTVGQAEAINNKFQTLEDSITGLNNQLNGAITSLNFTQNKVEILTDSINHIQDSLILVDKHYQQEVKRQDKLEFIDRKTRFQIKLGLVLVGAVWLYGIMTNK